MPKLILMWKRFLANRSTRLPVGLAEFNAWADSIAELTGPIADEVSMKFALASILIHADAKHGALPKSYFVDRLIKSAANQVASQVFQDLKLAQDAAKKAAEAALVTPVAVTTPSESVAVDVQKTDN